MSFVFEIDKIVECLLGAEIVDGLGRLPQEVAHDSVINTDRLLGTIQDSQIRAEALEGGFVSL